MRAFLKFGAVSKSDCIVDLGCGAGDFLNALADELDGVRCIGADIEHELIKQARLTSMSMGVAERVEYFALDFFKGDLEFLYQRATKVYLYLVPRQLHDIRFRAILTRFALAEIPIISYSFEIQYLTLQKYDQNFQLFQYGLPLIDTVVAPDGSLDKIKTI